MDKYYTESYTKEVLKLLRNPKNMGLLKDANGIAEVGNPVCGDVMRMYIKVSKNKKGEEFIENIKFQTLGCGAAIATSSILTTLVKGKTLKEAVKINKKYIIKALGGLPVIKIHCSVLADEALKKAVKDYQAKL